MLTEDVPKTLDDEVSETGIPLLIAAAEVPSVEVEHADNAKALPKIKTNLNVEFIIFRPFFFKYPFFKTGREHLYHSHSLFFSKKSKPFTPTETVYPI